MEKMTPAKKQENPPRTRGERRQDREAKVRVVKVRVRVRVG